MSKVEHCTVSKDEDGMRLDRWFSHHYPDVPFSAIQRACRKGEVRVNKGRVKGRERLEIGQEIRVPPFTRKPPPKKPSLSKKETDFIRSLVIYEDDYFFALNKPAGLATQGGTKTKDHIDRLLEGLPLKNEQKPRLVHRLDKETSGVLLVARTREAASKAGKMFMSRYMRKTYLALTAGVPEMEQATIDAPLLKKRVGGQDKMVRDDTDGQHAITDYAMLDYAHQTTALLALFPKTGRQHQLRAHLEIIGNPILGDDRYGGAGQIEGMELPDNLMLHAYALDFEHPFQKGKKITITAPLPDHFTKAEGMLGMAFHKSNLRTVQALVFD